MRREIGLTGLGVCHILASNREPLSIENYCLDV